MIGYHQPELSTKRTVYTLSLQLDSVIGQLVRHFSQGVIRGQLPQKKFKSWSFEM